jgi:6-phosphogluconate dehydrogenase (decarboxylating)
MQLGMIGLGRMGANMAEDEEALIAALRGAAA